MIVCTVRAMASARINMRLDQELWGWVAVYARRRDATRTQIVEAALREFREACEGGVPGLEQASVDDTQAVSPAGRSSGDSHAGHHASATGAASARSASRPPAPARAPALEKPHVASVREMRQMPRPAQSEWERTMLSRQQRLNRGKG